MELELIIHKLRAEAIRCEEIKDDKITEIKKMKNKLEMV